MWTLPNLLSLFRIAIIPVLVYLLTFTDRLSGALAALFFLVASLTDYFDGYLARRNKSVSDLGKLLDPLADKLMIVATLIMLAAIDRPGNQVVPAWLVVVIVGRESAVTILRGLALADGIVIEAEKLGKYKLILQTFAVIGLMLHYPYLGINFYTAGMYFLVLATVVAVWSGVDYHVKFIRLVYLRATPSKPGGN
jgi:CDP-diacylglycerol--glycerol-3-phosphate 3-phosphatidyltransferase